MVRNTLQEEEGLGDQLKEAIFEPKMTRSKIKEVLENGNVRNSLDDFGLKKGHSCLLFTMLSL